MWKGKGEGGGEEEEGAGLSSEARVCARTLGREQAREVERKGLGGRGRGVWRGVKRDVWVAGWWEEEREVRERERERERERGRSARFSASSDVFE